MLLHPQCRSALFFNCSETWGPPCSPPLTAQKGVSVILYTQPHSMASFPRCPLMPVGTHPEYDHTPSHLAVQAGPRRTVGRLRMFSLRCVVQCKRT